MDNMNCESITNQEIDPNGVSRVLVCGGGHQGFSMAAYLTLHDVSITLWNRTAENISEVIRTKEIHCDGVVKGTAFIEKASNVVSEVYSDFIMVTTPSSAHKDIARTLAPYVSPDTIIVLNPGRTFGAIEFANTLLECGVKELPHIAETQTIVFTCRRSDRNSTTIFALKEDVKIAALKKGDIHYIMERMPMCLRHYFGIVDSVLFTSLTNVGMVLHCSPVLMNIGWIESETVDFKYYYDGISKSVASFLEKIDAERQHVAEAIGCPVESVADWLKRTYKVEGNSLYACIRNNQAYREIDAPPTIRCRYLMEDVPNGLVPVETLGKELGIETKSISTIIDLASAVVGIDFRTNGRSFNLGMLKKYIL